MKRKNKQEKKQRKQLKNEMFEKFDAHKVPEFPSKFRGYDRDDVDRYLNFLVDAYLKLHSEYTSLETEVSEYREKKTAIADLLIDEKMAAGQVSSVVYETHIVPEENPPELLSIEELLAVLDAPLSVKTAVTAGRGDG